MYGKGGGIAYAHYGTHEVGTGTQMGIFTQIFDAVTLGTHGVGVGIFYKAQHLYGFGMHLHALSLALRGNEGTVDGYGATGGKTQDLVIII